MCTGKFLSWWVENLNHLICFNRKFGVYLMHVKQIIIIININMYFNHHLVKRFFPSRIMNIDHPTILCEWHRHMQFTFFLFFNSLHMNVKSESTQLFFSICFRIALFSIINSSEFFSQILIKIALNESLMIQPNCNKIYLILCNKYRKLSSILFCW